MPIQRENLELVESQVMDDVPEGGGALTGNAIESGVMNNLFPDVSDLDRATGRWRARKVGMRVRTFDTDKVLGSRLAINQLPTDPFKDYVLFRRNDAFDTRADAVDYAAGYYVAQVQWPGALLGRHNAGQSLLSVIQPPNSELPPRNRVLQVSSDEGGPNETSEYVRVVDVEYYERETYDANGYYSYWEVRMTLEQPLQNGYQGHEPVRSFKFDYDNEEARLRDTGVSDAFRGYGSRVLTQAASIGDKTLNVDSVFAQLAPSNRSEEPLANQPTNPALTITLDAGAREVQVSEAMHTRAFKVTAENRRLNYVDTLRPIPKPGAYTLDYYAAGRWYQLVDDGAGNLTSTSVGAGSGTIDYVTGTRTVTLAALPDVGSIVLDSWGTEAHFEQLVGAADLQTAPRIDHEFGEAIAPGTLALSWTSGGVAKMATADLDGLISGDAEGTITHATGRLELFTDAQPDPGTSIAADYDTRATNTYTITGLSASAGLVTLDAAEAVEPGTVTCTWYTQSLRTATGKDFIMGETCTPAGAGLNCSQTVKAVVPNAESSSTRFRHTLTDDGQGGIGVDGIVTYATGEIVLPVIPLVDQESWNSGDWSEETSTNFIGIVVLSYAQAGTGTTSVSTTIAAPAISLRLLPPIATRQVVPNSVQFSWNGQTYEDRGDGILYTDIDPATGAGTEAGAIDYESGVVELTDYTPGAGAVEVTSLLSRRGQWLADAVYFRTASAPLAVQATQILATAADGELLSLTDDADGNLTGGPAEGSVNTQFGVVDCTFGEWVVDANLTDDEKAEWWYDAANVQGDGTIWRPRQVDPTLVYNTVALQSLPVPEELVGIPTTQLPPDGRILIFRPGEPIEIMHPQTTAPATIANGDSIATRPRVSWVRPYDANGDEITSGWELDHATGAVTFPDVAGIAQPITVESWISDLVVCADVQIGGIVEVNLPITHDYPADETIVAAPLPLGDRWARVVSTWDQATWNGEFLDYPVGDSSIATMDFLNHPPTVDNDGAETQIWVLRCTSGSSNTFELIGDKVGKVWSGEFTPVGDDIAPINPRTRTYDEGSGTWIGGRPYLTIPAAANGGGWSTGNTIHFVTEAAAAEVWIAQSLQPSEIPAGDGEDGAELVILTNVNRP